MTQKYIRYLLFYFCFNIFNLVGLSNLPSNTNNSLNKKSIHNFSVFNKVYGYVRHFSPSLNVDTFYGWEDLLLKYLPRVETAQSDDELCSILSECFYFLDSNLIIKPYLKGNPFKNRETIPCNNFYIFRDNHGWGNRGENAVSMNFPMYKSSLQKTNKFTDFETVYQNIYIWMPLVTCINENEYKHFNVNKEFNPNSKKGKYKTSNKYVRIGIIMEVWNVNEYFYPYMHVMKINNEAIFEKYIKSVFVEVDDSIFFEILEKFGAEYKDGHAGFMPFTPSINWPDYVPPLKLQMINHKLIVTYVADSIKHLIGVGDHVVKIEDIEAGQYFQNKQSCESSATKTWNRYISEKELLCGMKSSWLKLEFLKGTKKATIYLTRSVKVNENENNANLRPNYYEIKEGYYYVNLFGLNDSLLNYAFTNYLPHAKGIVFDARGYPKSRRVKELLSHLTSDTLYSSNWSIPIQRFPGQKKMYFRDSTFGWVLPALSPKYTDNVVFVTDGRTISGAEGFMSIVEHYKLGQIIGEQTAGTNGNINSFQLFGLYQFWHTEMFIPQYNGLPFHGVGIIPQKILKPNSQQNLIEGKDKFILEALKLLR